MERKNSRPRLGEDSLVYVPKEEFQQEIAIHIREGSGIVGFARNEDDPHRIFYYEGNLYGASNMREWDDRVKNAYGRMATSYPTSAMIALPVEKFEVVGKTDGVTVEVTNQDAVDRWNDLAKPRKGARP